MQWALYNGILISLIMIFPYFLLPPRHEKHTISRLPAPGCPWSSTAKTIDQSSSIFVTPTLNESRQEVLKHPKLKLPQSAVFRMEDYVTSIFPSLDLCRQLKIAVTCNMVAMLDQLLETDGIDVDLPLEGNGDTALHIAARRGHHDCMDKLLNTGAHPDQPNDYGFTPMSYALRDGNTRCVRLLYQTGTPLCDPRMIWINHNSLDGVPMWSDYSVDMMKLLLIATPNMSQLGASVVNNFWDLHLKSLHSVPLVRMFVLTGNRLSLEQMAALLNQAEGDTANSLRALQGAHSLQHYARVAIRRRLVPNTISASRELPLPAKLQEFLLYEEGVWN